LFLNYYYIPLFLPETIIHTNIIANIITATTRASVVIFPVQPTAGEVIIVVGDVVGEVIVGVV
jgi:hypothetical protein